MSLKITTQNFTLLLLCILLIFEFGNAETPTKLTCVPNVVATFGMEGLDTPEVIELSMCPMINVSCCKRSDQMTLFSSWDIGGESKALLERLSGYYEVYAALIDEAVNVSDFASSLAEKLKDRKISNCKVLAKRIAHFEIKEIAPKLKEVIKSMNEFFYTSYQGIYCAVCDAEMHPFINVEMSEIIFSKKFCRDVMAHSLPFLLYFHVHFIKFLNLLIKFTTFCDYQGVFVEKGISENDFFAIDRSTRDKLDLCKTFHNEHNWFEMCSFICEKFNVIEYNNFFEPNLQKYHDTTTLLKQLLAAAQTPITDGTEANGSSPTGKLRLLGGNNSINVSVQPGSPTAGADELEIKQSDIHEAQAVYPHQIVIRSAYLGIIPISEMKSGFDDPGIDLYDYGKGSRMTRTAYDTIAAEVNAKNGNGNMETDDGSNGKGKEASVWRNCLALMLVSFTLLVIK